MPAVCTRSTWYWLLGAILLSQPYSAVAQQVEPGGDESIKISGFINATLWWQDQVFGPSNGQNAIWAASPELFEDQGFAGGDIRATRLTISFDGPEISQQWKVEAGLEADFFGGFTGAGPYAEQQPNPRLRLAYADLTNGRTTIRIGQYWTPTFGLIPQSLSHIGFPPGWGGGGMIGWRFPGIFFYHDLTPKSRTEVQLQLALFRNSWSIDFIDGVDAGQASALPQVEARLNLTRRPKTGTPWQAYLAAHWDLKDMNGPGIAHSPYINGWAAVGGFEVHPGRWKVLLQGYGGHAIGQIFAQILQFGNFGSWGIQGQLGYEFDDHWSLWTFYGIDNPSRRAPVLFRNQIILPMLRYQFKQYSIGLEWYRAVTQHRLDDGDDQFSGNQVGLSIRYDF